MSKKRKQKPASKKTLWRAMTILIVLAAISLITTYLILAVLPEGSEAKGTVEKYGFSITFAGGIGAFLLVFFALLRAYPVVVSIVSGSAAVFLIFAVPLYQRSTIGSPQGVGIIGMIPYYQDYTLRSKVAEVLNESAMAKLMVMEFCQTNQDAELSNEVVGFFPPDSQYIEKIETSGDCSAPIIRIFSKVDELEVSPVLELVVQVDEKSSYQQWACRTIRGDEKYVPSACRQRR